MANKLSPLLLLLLCLATASKAQTPTYGKIDTADLKLASCNFDKGANAMILFDVGKIAYNKTESIVMERHTRIKIFNDKANDEANIRLEYYSGYDAEEIKNIEAQTINLVGNTIVSTPLDPKLIYNEKVDKMHRAMIFTMPNVKPGSIIDLKYVWKTAYGYNYPNWFFQSKLPTRYSKVEAHVNYGYFFNFVKKTTQKLDTDTSFIAKGRAESTHLFSMVNVPGFRFEPYMHSAEDNLQGIFFKPARNFRTWQTIVNEILTGSDLSNDLRFKPENAAAIVAGTKNITSRNEKISYIFNMVKNSMKWNYADNWHSDEGLKKPGKTKQATLPK